jgi:very-short-patch-repair endonuclease
VPTRADLERGGLIEVRPGDFVRREKKETPSTIQAPTPAGNSSGVFRLSETSSILESRFAFLWKSLGGPELQSEYRFSRSRRWRADFAHVPSMVLIEIEGGLYSGVGRHNRAAGYTADSKKYNAATLLGFSIFRFTSKMLNPDEIRPVIDFIRAKTQTLSKLEDSK